MEFEKWWMSPSVRAFEDIEALHRRMMGPSLDLLRSLSAEQVRLANSITKQLQDISPDLGYLVEQFQAPATMRHLFGGEAFQRLLGGLSDRHFQPTWATVLESRARLEGLIEELEAEEPDSVDTKRLQAVRQTFDGIAATWHALSSPARALMLQALLGVLLPLLLHYQQMQAARDTEEVIRARLDRIEAVLAESIEATYGCLQSEAPEAPEPDQDVTSDEDDAGGVSPTRRSRRYGSQAHRVRAPGAGQHDRPQEADRPPERPTAARAA
jgi:hypothetical protein